MRQRTRSSSETTVEYILLWFHHVRRKRPHFADFADGRYDNSNLLSTLNLSRAYLLCCRRITYNISPLWPLWRSLLPSLAWLPLRGREGGVSVTHLPSTLARPPNPPGYLLPYKHITYRLGEKEMRFYPWLSHSRSRPRPPSYVPFLFPPVFHTAREAPDVCLPTRLCFSMLTNTRLSFCK